MITYKQFLGINNVEDPTRVKPGEMLVASNVDIAGTLLSRRGRFLRTAGGAHSLYEAPFGLLAVVDNDLLLLDADGDEVRTVYETIGYTRVWYADLPDGRVAFSNGLISGLCTAADTTPWGLPVPPDPGVGIPGDTPYIVTYERSSDGRESAPTYGTVSIDTTQAIIGLPALAGHVINVYLAPYGEAMFLAGSTATDTWTPTGADLGPQFVGGVVDVPPVGTILAAWHGRMLIADGSVLWATRPLQPDLCDRSRDFVQFEHPITLLYGTGSGLFVGTTQALHFLAGGDIGTELQFRTVIRGPATKGSAVEIDTAYLPANLRTGGRGALAIVDGVLTLLAGDGQAIPLTAARYQRELDEVWATTRLRDGTLQYLASPA